MIRRGFVGRLSCVQLILVKVLIHQHLQFEAQMINPHISINSTKTSLSAKNFLQNIS